MKKILVATDFSLCASNAMEYAMKLARVLNFNVCAIHAIGSMEGVNNDAYSALYIEDYRNNKKRALAEWAGTFSDKEKFKEVDVTTHCGTGSVNNVISEFISSNPVEFLVAGSMGTTGIAGLFGSNVNSMVSSANIPTLIIPLERKFSKKPNITLATDLNTKLSAKGVAGLNEIAISLKTKKLNILNIIGDGGEWVKNASGEKEFEKLFVDNELVFEYIIEDNTVQGILNYIVKSGTDILCVVKRQHNLIYRLFNKSMVNQVMNRSVKAVLVLHE